MNGLRQVVIGDETVHATLHEWIQKAFNIRWITVFAVGISIAVMVPHYITLKGHPESYVAFQGRPMTYSGFYMLTVTTLVVYFITCGAASGIISILVYKRIFGNYEIKLDVLNRDQRGGLSAFMLPNRYYNYFMIVAGIIILVFWLHDILFFDNYFTYRVILSVIMYVFLFPLLFFSPIYIMHYRMSVFRSDILERIGNELSKLFEKLMQENGMTSERIERFENLKSVYTTVPKYPDWPVPVSSIIEWLGAYLLPAVITIIFHILPSP